ncbi:MAG TPA: DUF1684 domain-containing protein [Pyrinomonadaceae bacterium]|nr:DUF1684 domain-containing protein [Pyrinomonadaceae bacterium]
MRVFSLLIIISFTCFVAPSQRLAQTTPIGGQADTNAWRNQHEAELLKPDGWLSLIGLEWLEPGDNTVGSAPDNKIHLPVNAPSHLGILRFEEKTVTIAPPKEGFPSGLTIAGRLPTERTLPTGADSDKDNPRIRTDSLEMYVIVRGDRYGLRIKDSQSAAIRAFHGLNWFPVNTKYRITASWLPYDPPKTTRLSTLIGTSYSQPVPGVAEFMLDGKRYRLEPVIEDPGEAKLFFIVRDTTSKSTTYGACRFLYTNYPENGLKQPGKLVLDFNRLENPPCAYTSFATCPLPPPGNRLPIPIPAGEKRYHD